MPDIVIRNGKNMNLLFAAIGATATISASFLIPFITWGKDVEFIKREDQKREAQIVQLQEKYNANQEKLNLTLSGLKTEVCELRGQFAGKGLSKEVKCN